MEVQQVVRVGRATEAHFYSLGVFGIGVHHVQHGGVAILCGEVRNDLDNASAAFVYIKRSGGSHGGARQAQATNHGGDAQGQNIFFHTNLQMEKREGKKQLPPQWKRAAW